MSRRALTCRGGSVLPPLSWFATPTFYFVVGIYINYINPHFLLTALFSLYSDLLNLRLDTFLFPLDAIV